MWKEEAKVRGQHRRAPGWDAFLNGYIHWELAGTCICSPTPSPVLLPRAPPSDPEEVQAQTFLRIIPSHFSSLGNSSGPCGLGGPGEPSTDNSTHRGAGQTLQTGEATVSLQSPLASLSSFSLVTSGALRALGTRHTDTVGSAQPRARALCRLHLSQGAPGPCATPPPPPATEPPRQDPARDTQALTGIPRAPAGPAGPMGPCAPCGESGDNVRQQPRQGWPTSASAHGLGTEAAAPQPRPRVVPRAWGRAGEGGRWGGAPCPPSHPPVPWPFTDARYSQLLLGLPACQLGRRDQESQGARELQGHPQHRSPHGHPVRREVPGSERNFQRRQGGTWLCPRPCQDEVSVPPHRTRHSP